MPPPIQTIETATLRSHLADVVREVERRKKYILVTRKSRPTVALVNLDLFEDLLALSSKSYLRSIRQARQDVKAGRVFSHEEVFGRLA